MKPTIFREYDIRGIVGDELIIEQAFDLAQAIATHMLSQHPKASHFIIGRDGRTHSNALFEKITAALCAMGLDVIDVGIVPSPVVYFAVHHLNIQTALVITASHNPKEYNGIKMWGIHGHHIQQIRKIFESKTFKQHTDKKGIIVTYNIIDPYIDYLVNQFQHLKSTSLRMIIDCGNGVAGTVMPQLIKRMNWSNTQLLFDTVDGTFPNHEADPTVPENMTFVAHALQNDPLLDIGLGLDGDCDRMAPMTQEGTLVTGDMLLALFAQRTLQKNPGATIVCDIKSSSCLIDTLTEWGARPYMAPSGHSLIKQAMIDQNALLAGELSCHFFFKDRYFGYDDGIYAALRTIELLHDTEKTLDELLKQLPHKISSPEIRIACASEADKAKIVDHAKEILGARKDLSLITIDGIRAQSTYGWGLLRASNTQSVISLRFESDTTEGLAHIKTDFYNLLVDYFDTQTLREKIDI